MAIYHEDIAEINLNGGSLHRNFKTVSIGSGDQNANRFGMRVFRDGEPVDLSEVECQAVFQDPMGNNIALTNHGTVGGNTAYVTLPQACYNYEGRFCLAIKLIGGGVTGTMRIVDGVINNTHTGGTVAPTGAVPTYQEVLAAYDDAIAAIETVGEMKALIMTTLNDTTPAMTWEQGGLRSSDGGAPQQQASNRIRMITYLNTQSVFRVTCAAGYKADVYQYTENRIAGYTVHSGWFTGTKDFPGGYYYRICGAKENDGNLTPDAKSNYEVTVFTATDKTLTKDGVPADAKAAGDIFAQALCYRGMLPNGTDLNDVTQEGMYNLRSDGGYINGPSINEVSNLYVLGSPSINAQIVVGRLQKIRYRFNNSGTRSDWVRLAEMPDFLNTFANVISLTSEDNLNVITNTSLAFFASSSVPDNAPLQTGGLVATFVYSSTYRMQIYVNANHGYYFRMRAYDGWTKWKNISKDKEELDFVVEKGGWTNKGTKVNPGIKGLRSNKIFKLVPGSVLTFYLDEGWTYSIKHGDSSGKISPIVSQSKEQTYIVEKPYNAFQFNKFVDGESVDLDVDDFNQSVIIRSSGDATASKQDTENHDFPETAGQLNVIYRAYQMSKIVFETKATLPLHSGGSKSVTVRDKPAGTVITGISYSSMRETMASVPQATSLQAFRTMIENPDSYIYTKHYEQSAPDYDYNSRCYVGAVCSTLVAWCYGIDDVIPTTIAFANYPGFNQLPANQQNPQSLKLADMLNKAGDHIVIVTDIIRTSRGKVEYIEVTEAAKPLCRSVRFTQDEINSEYFDNGYVAYRYADVDDVTYTPSPWVHVDDDETSQPTYNTVISPKKGEESNWKVGEDIEIDILDNTAEYTHFILKNEGSGTEEDPEALPAGTVITITGLDEGKYSVRLSDGENESDKVRFDVIEAEPEYEDLGGHQVRVTFESETNRVPTAVYWCCNVVSSSDYKAVRAFHILTAEEIEQGYADVDEPTGMRDTDSNNGVWLMRMNYKTEYGLFASDLEAVQVSA